MSSSAVLQRVGELALFSKALSVLTSADEKTSLDTVLAHLFLDIVVWWTVEARLSMLAREAGTPGRTAVAQPDQQRFSGDSVTSVQQLRKAHALGHATEAQNERAETSNDE